MTPGKRAGTLKASEAQQFAGWWRSANKGFKNGSGKIRDGYAQCPRSAFLHLSCGMVLGSLDPGTSLEVGEGSRCICLGEIRVVAAAQLIFGFVCLWSGEGSCNLLNEAGQVDVSLR